jgi:hypothetical protein
MPQLKKLNIAIGESHSKAVCFGELNHRGWAIQFINLQHFSFFDVPNDQTEACLAIGDHKTIFGVEEGGEDGGGQIAEMDDRV